jgi:hypothetical protein
VLRSYARIYRIDGYNPTTPYKPPPSKKRATASKPSSSGGRSVAGPSKAKPPSGTGVRKRMPSRTDSAAVTVIEDEEDDVEEHVSPARELRKDLLPSTRSRTETNTTIGSRKGSNMEKEKDIEIEDSEPKRSISPMVIESSDIETHEVAASKKHKEKTATQQTSDDRLVARLKKQLAEVH